MRISFTTLACPQWDLDTILARGKEYGYDGLDFRGLKSEVNSLWNLPEFSTEIDQTAAKVRDSGLAVSALSSSATLTHAEAAKADEAVETVVRYAEMCRKVGSDFIRVFGGHWGEMGEDRAVEVSAKVADRMAAAAGPDIQIAIETHDNWVSTGPLKRLMQAVTAPNLCVLWDLNHPFRFAHETPEQTYANIGQWVRATHVKDSVGGEGDECIYKLPGEGDVPMAEMVALLKRGGYDGWLTLEWEKRWHPELAEPEVSLPAYAKYLKQFV